MNSVQESKLFRDIFGAKWSSDVRVFYWTMFRRLVFLK
jgi:hypothetical protein